MNCLKKLHDAILTEVHLRWEQGELRLWLRPSQIYTTTPTICLFANGLTDFTYPRKFPWGESVSVNSFTVKIGQGNTLIAIEMQSGDVIEITCKQFNFEPPLEKMTPPASVWSGAVQK